MRDLRTCLKLDSMKIFALLFGLSISAHASEWKEGIQAPESVVFDDASHVAYISNIVGEGTVKDGQGWISRVEDPRGKAKLTAQWVSGLNAPKGMRIFMGILWVSDIDELVSIDIATAKIKAKIPCPGARFLNDVAVDDSGRVFVSDTLSSRIYVVSGGKAEVFVEGPDYESPNGLLVDNGKLIVAAWGFTSSDDFSTKTPGRLYSVGLVTKKKILITPQPIGNLDGLERWGKDAFVVSDWIKGTVMKVDAKSGKTTKLFSGYKGAADLAVDGEKGAHRTPLIYLPATGENRVVILR